MMNDDFLIANWHGRECSERHFSPVLSLNCIVAAISRSRDVQICRTKQSEIHPVK